MRLFSEGDTAHNPALGVKTAPPKPPVKASIGKQMTIDEAERLPLPSKPKPDRRKKVLKGLNSGKTDSVFTAPGITMLGQSQNERVKNPVIKGIMPEDPEYRKPSGMDVQIVNLPAMLINEQLGTVMVRYKVCTCAACCEGVTSTAASLLPTVFIKVSGSSDAAEVNQKLKEMRPEVVKVLTKLCISARNRPFH